MAERTDTLARALVDAREEKDRTEKIADSAKKRYKTLEREFWEHLNDIGQTTGTFDLGEGYGKVQFQKRETIRGIVTDHEKAVQAIIAAGYDDALLGPQKLQQRALNEQMRTWLNSGQPIPEGLDFNPSRYVSITRK